MDVCILYTSGSALSLMPLLEVSSAANSDEGLHDNETVLSVFRLSSDIQ